MTYRILYVPFLILILFLMSCGTGLTNETYSSTSGRLYIKFLDDHTLEWKNNYEFRPEEYEYVLDGNKIRATRKSFGQVSYIRIIDKKTLQVENGTEYYLK